MLISSSELEKFANLPVQYWNLSFQKQLFAQLSFIVHVIEMYDK